MEFFSFSGRFVQKVIVLYFSRSLDQKAAQQSDGSCNVTSESRFLEKIFQKTVFYYFRQPI